MDILNEETPAYKLQNSGVSALTDAELLALIIANGTTTAKATDALEAARKLLSAGYSNLQSIGRMSFAQYRDAGLSDLQVGKLVAAIELGRRRHRICSHTTKSLTS